LASSTLGIDTALESSLIDLQLEALISIPNRSTRRYRAEDPFQT
jgi:hypothetical protein